MVFHSFCSWCSLVFPSFLYPFLRFPIVLQGFSIVFQGCPSFSMVFSIFSPSFSTLFNCFPKFSIVSPAFFHHVPSFSMFSPSFLHHFSRFSIVFHAFFLRFSKVSPRFVQPPAPRPEIHRPRTSKRSAEATGVTMREAARDEVIRPRFRARSWLWRRWDGILP